ncbi:MAG: helix-turn-helix domain-containing protein [Gordonia sp. (in: high G+C Gram-positive bacteria)]|uniref:helix-turn-helix transcriptional regulator n=1 Tax=Gordonia sp. (in: high G+C Gram-positive bacteria) TaxID=84139 RepID=UPI003C71793B
MHNVITAAEVADLLQLSRTEVIRRAGDGRLPTTSKLPGRTGAYLFDRAAIEELTGASC